MPGGNEVWAAIAGAIVGAVVTYLLTRAAEGERRRWSGRERISEMLAVIFSDYTALSIRTTADIDNLRKQWAPAGYLFDLLHDEAIGSQLDQIVTDYLGLLNEHVQGKVSGQDVDAARSGGWRKAKERLEEYVNT
jgi:hypothetical protein